MNNSWIVIIMSFLLLSCGNYRKTIDRQGNQKVYNLTYGKHKRNKIDVFVPQNAKDDTFILIIHGGAWTLGRKSHLRPVQNFLLKEGYSTAAMNYRLVDKNTTYKAQLEDVDKAIRYLKDSMRIKKFVLLGESSGGHLAMLYGYQHPETTEKIITFAGPTDFYSDAYFNTKLYHWYTKKKFSKVVGEKYNDKDTIAQAFKEASPLYHVSNVPTLTFQGGWDYLVHPQQSFALDSALTERNIPHELVFIKGASHTPRFLPWWRHRIIYPKIKTFLEKDF